MITKSEVRDRVKWILSIIFGWWIAMPLGEYIVKISPIKNTLWLGVIGLFIILFFDN